MKKTILALLLISAVSAQAAVVINDPHANRGASFGNSCGQAFSQMSQGYANRIQRENEQRNQYSYEECRAGCDAIKEDYTPEKHSYWIKVAKSQPIPIYMRDDLIDDLNKMKSEYDEKK